MFGKLYEMATEVRQNVKEKVIMIGIGVGAIAFAATLLARKVTAEGTTGDTVFICTPSGCTATAPLPGCLTGWDDASCQDTADPCNPEYVIVSKWVQADGAEMWFVRYADMRFVPPTEGISPTYTNPQALIGMLTMIAQDQGDGQRITKRQLDCALVQIAMLRGA